MKRPPRVPPVRAPGSGGFSLVEVLCALLILGVGIVGISQGVTLSLSSSKESERQTAASLLAASRIETIRAEGYFTAGEKEGDFGDEFPAYGWRQTIAETPIDGLYEVTVAVELAASKEEVYELKTMLFKMPAYESSTEEGRKGRTGGPGAGPSHRAPGERGGNP